MSARKLLGQLTIALFLCSLFLPGTVTADLAGYVKKYQSSDISQESLARIRRYDHLIEYFTSFSYFRQGYRVSPDFVRALILAESGGDPRAVSAKNAIGLGQIIPSTGELAARELAGTATSFRYVSKRRLAGFAKDDLFDPAVNILLTCYLIAKYNHMFDGRLELVLSAWNAGENTDSLAKGKHAPYQETKELIGKVNGYYLYLLKKKGAVRF